MRSTFILRFFVVCMGLIVCGLQGCTAKYATHIAGQTLSDARLRADYMVERSASWVIPAKTPVFLAQPQDISYQHRNRQVFNLYRSLDHTLKLTFPAYVTDDSSRSLGSALAEAAGHRSELLFIPKLVSAEDRRSSRQEMLEGGSLHPDKELGADEAVFQILVYEVRAQKLIDVVVVKGRSGMFSSAVQLPQDLFDQAALHFAYAITGKSHGLVTVR